MIYGRFEQRLWMGAFVMLACLIVYPDKALQKLSERTGTVYVLRHHIYVMVGAIAGLGIADWIAMSSTIRIHGWEALYAVALVGGYRILMRIVAGFFGFSND